MILSLSFFGPFGAALDGRSLKIPSRRSQALLAMLALSPKATVSRDRLSATLWPDRAEEQARASLRQELSALKRALGDAGNAISADATSVRIDRAFLSDSFGDPQDGEFLEGLDIKSEPFDDWRRSLAVAELQVAGNHKVDAHDIFENPSVLVAAFSPASSNEEDLAFATGLTVDLRNAVALWRRFPVIGPEAVGWKNDRDRDLRELAKSVNAAYAICGMVRRAGERIRVSASLTDVKSGHLLWSESFDGEMADLFEMQDAISRAAVARITPQIGQAEAARIVQKPPTSMATWQLMAQTDELERNGGEGYGTPESNKAQVPLLRQALEREPDFARAWIRLARYYFRSAMQGWVDDRTGYFDKALEYSAKAVNLEPQDWESHALRSIILVFGRQDFEPARFHGLEAVRLNPSAPTARHAIGCALEWMGETELSLKHLYRIFDLDPNYVNRSAVLGDITTCELFEGRLDKAATAARQIKTFAPNYCRGLQRVAVTLGHAGDIEGAAEALQRVYELQPDFDEAYVRETYPFADPKNLDIILSGLRLAGWKG